MGGVLAWSEMVLGAQLYWFLDGLLWLVSLRENAVEALEVLSNRGIFYGTRVDSRGKKDQDTFIPHVHFATSSVFGIKPSFPL